MQEHDDPQARGVPGHDGGGTRGDQPVEQDDLAVGHRGQGRVQPFEVVGAGRRPGSGHGKLDHTAAARLLATEDPAVVDVAAAGAGWVVDRAREDGVQVSHGVRS